MNPVLVYKIISYLVLIISGFMLIPGGIALVKGEYPAFTGFLITISISISNFIFMLICTRGRENGTLSAKDGFLFVTSSWIAAAFIGALPFYLSGAMPAFVNAVFETMSGFTTTGASILSDIESLPSSILFWRSLTHWLGGMG
ncbi:MAG TPA: potassium transporter TrkG, partial [Spirochaetota bacterium]|nr:potassium transporter TrkG [Spirochaetota bacterium]HPR38942.1 potassium transporter TrkG [Spirochaetota bacterium]